MKQLVNDLLSRMNRREFLSSAGLVIAIQSLQTRPRAGCAGGCSAAKADHTLRIEPCTLEIGPGVTVKTLAYNGQVPGPLLRLREGVPVTIDVTNAALIRISFIGMGWPSTH